MDRSSQLKEMYYQEKKAYDIWSKKENDTVF